MKVCHVSWNAPETVFHEMLWKKSFSVPLPQVYDKLSEASRGLLFRLQISSFYSEKTRHAHNYLIMATFSSFYFHFKSTTLRFPHFLSKSQITTPPS